MTLGVAAYIKPKFRDELLAAAKEHRYVYQVQVMPTVTKYQRSGRHVKQ